MTSCALRRRSLSESRPELDRQKAAAYAAGPGEVLCLKPDNNTRNVVGATSRSRLIHKSPGQFFRRPSAHELGTDCFIPHYAVQTVAAKHKKVAGLRNHFCRVYLYIVLRTHNLSEDVPHRMPLECGCIESIPRHHGIQPRVVCR